MHNGDQLSGLFDEPPPCQHLHTGLFLHGTHIGEHCTDCGAQLPKPGAWIPHKEVQRRRIDVTKLVQWRGRPVAIHREIETL